MRPAPERNPVPSAPFWCATTLWILVLLACFALQQVVVVHMGKPYDAYIALSGYGMKSWHLWELLTCNLLHCGWLHLLVNLVGFWFLGRALETRIGWRRLLGFCLVASVTGGLLQGGVAASGFLLPESMETTASFVRERFGGPVYGASISLGAVFAALCLMKPGGGKGPSRFLGLNAAYLFWPTLGIALLLVIVPTNPDLPHLAHLGAILAGAAMIPWLHQALKAGG
jgi:membrane associated rhomboid family serine protease